MDLSFLTDMGATPAVKMVFIMGLPVAYLAWHNMKKNKALTEKYNQLDKLTLLNSFLLSDITGKKIVNIHRNGDYEIVNPLNQKEQHHD